jgi:hypothetical protein
MAVSLVVRCINGAWRLVIWRSEGVLGFETRLGSLGQQFRPLITQGCRRKSGFVSRAGNLSHWRSTDQYDTAEQVTLKEVNLYRADGNRQRISNRGGYGLTER